MEIDLEIKFIFNKKEFCDCLLMVVKFLEGEGGKKDIIYLLFFDLECGFL